MIKHTPGPWYASYHCILDKNHRMIATVLSDMHRECKPNARLLAAAPELLAALECLSAEEYRDDDDPILMQARVQARAAITKARGEK